jgi:hypothetical protein
MLAWRQERNGWVSNGYRIELLEPHHWVLLKNEPRPEAVRAEPIPLAETRTLTQCKREAELLDAAGRLSLIRRRRWAQLIMAAMAFAFVPSMPPPLDLTLFLVLLAIAAGAIGFLAGTYMARSHLAVSDLSDRRSSSGDDRLCLWPTRYLARFRISL